MRIHKIKKGLDLPISGAPDQTIADGPTITRVAFVADDFQGLKPRLLVKVGDFVRRGQILLEDRNIEGVWHTSPGSGKVVEINRGARRALQTIVIELTPAEEDGRPGDEDFVSFEAFSGKSADELDRREITALLVESGLWTALRKRPFSKVPQPGSTPAAIFVTAIDTNPLAPRPEVVLADQKEDFDRGLKLIAKLTDGTTYLCVRPDAGIEDELTASVSVEGFKGPHPAGTVGVHIHKLAPVSRKRTVWHIGYQDVASIGRLFSDGRLDVRRVISIAGPPVDNPRLVRTRVGASVKDLAGDEGVTGKVRWISGSVFSGKGASSDVYAYLGRFDNQISVLEEDDRREFMAWAGPGFRMFSVIPVFFSRFVPGVEYKFTTTTNGSRRAIIPIGVYERVMPIDIEPAYLLRSLVVGDVEHAERLGCLELAEEDLALCTFVDPGKEDFGRLLRKNLDMIEKEG